MRILGIDPGLRTSGFGVIDVEQGWTQSLNKPAAPVQ
jgi:Holliday junction resolvasome RuvABC endonuclease subunit